MLYVVRDDDGDIEIQRGLAGVAAVLRKGCPPRRFVVSGLLSLPGCCKTGLDAAKHYLQYAQNDLKELLGEPYIDLTSLKRTIGKREPMDIIFHAPPHIDTVYLAPAFVMSAVCVLWRKPSLHRWSIVGSLVKTNQLVGYYDMDKEYVDVGVSHGFDVFIIPEDNFKHVEKCLGDKVTRIEGETILEYKTKHRGEEKVVQLVFCKNMLDVVKYADREVWQPHRQLYKETLKATKAPKKI